MSQVLFFSKWALLILVSGQALYQTFHHRWFASHPDLAPTLPSPLIERWLTVLRHYSFACRHTFFLFVALRWNHRHASWACRLCDSALLSRL